MITASHNPPEFNGIKCIASDGTEASHSEESNIERLYETEIPCAEWSKIGEMHEVSGAGEAYVDAVISKLGNSLAIRNAGLKVVLDCANGAAFETTPLLLKKLGVRAITLNSNAQGEFPGHNSEPTEDNLADLKALTVSCGANLGIAHDGDADRCVFVDEKGNFVAGDKTLALISRAILGHEKGGIVVTPVATSSLVEEVVKDAGGSVVYTAVGSPTVAREMIKDGGVFGGEENGGLIFPKMQYCRDGAMGIATMLESLITYGPLSKQLESLPVYYTSKAKIKCPEERKQALLDYFRKNAEGKVDDTDGVKILFDNGWVLLRPSGTEPIFRIYSESKDAEVSETRANQYLAQAEEFLSKKD